EQLLDECPPDLRNWEWHYLKRLCHANLLTTQGHPGVGLGVCFSLDGKRMAGACGDMMLRVWDTATGQETLAIKGNGRGSAIRYPCFSPDGRWLVGTSDESAVVWDAATGREVLTHKKHSRGGSAACLSPDGQWLACTCGDNSIEVWDVATGQFAL